RKISVLFRKLSAASLSVHGMPVLRPLDFLSRSSAKFRPLVPVRNTPGKERPMSLDPPSAYPAEHLAVADLRPLGRTGLRVTPICVGTSPLAGMPGLYGYDVPASRAEATINAVLDGPLNFLDTSNNYGEGRAEQRIGAVLRRRGGLPDGVVLATKVDADPVTGDFSGERVRRSVAESLERLGLDRVQLMYLHDPEYHLSFAQAMA